MYCNSLDIFDSLVGRSNPSYRNSPDQCTTKFIELMRDFKEVITDSSESNATHSAPNPIRIAVLDTGFTVDKEDPFFYGSADKRVNLKLSKNFLGDDPNDLSDKHGHGTHIVRLLLSCTVNAEIVILKISNDSTLQRVRLEQLTKVRIRLSNVDKQKQPS